MNLLLLFSFIIFIIGYGYVRRVSVVFISFLFLLWIDKMNLILFELKWLHWTWSVTQCSVFNVSDSKQCKWTQLKCVAHFWTFFLIICIDAMDNHKWSRCTTKTFAQRIEFNYKLLLLLIFRSLQNDINGNFTQYEFGFCLSSFSLPRFN